MTRSTSVFLDVLRVAAAVLVFINHCAQFWYPSLFTMTSPLAHRAVVVFFVLSGYVISYSTLGRNTDYRHFTMARLSRLYSVVIPALFLTIFLQIVGKAANPVFYAKYNRGFDAVRYVLSSVFLQNIWTLSSSPPTNAPFWSLSYEFWYYVLFGCAVYLRPRFLKIGVILAISLFVGPNILLLMPCWLLGVGMFIYRERLIAGWPKSVVLLVVSSLAMLAAILFLPAYPFNEGHKGLWYSGAFLTDWLTALCVGATIISFDALQLDFPYQRAAGGIRYCADHTFSLYLYHFPLIAFATALIAFNKAEAWQVTGVTAGVILIVLLLSHITEARRQGLRKALEWLFDAVFKRQVVDGTRSK